MSQNCAFSLLSQPCSENIYWSLPHYSMNVVAAVLVCAANSTLHMCIYMLVFVFLSCKHAVKSVTSLFMWLLPHGLFISNPSSSRIPQRLTHYHFPPFSSCGWISLAPIDLDAAPHLLCISSYWKCKECSQTLYWVVPSVSIKKLMKNTWTMWIFFFKWPTWRKTELYINKM